MKRNVLKCILSLAICAAMVMPATVSYAAEVTPEEQMASPSPSPSPSMSSSTETGDFQIVNGVLVSYTGTATDVVIPEELGATRIASGAFAMKNITSVTIPGSVTSIESNAFTGCSNLTSITIPGSVTSIGSNAFGGTPWLENKRNENPLVIINNILVDAENSSGDVVIPDGVTSIATYAFLNRTDLTSITIPNSVKEIGSDVFRGCSALTSVTIPRGVTRLERGTFSGCSALASLYIPNTVTDISENNREPEDYIFWNCDNLTIYGEEGSYIQEYAIAKGIPFQIYSWGISEETGSDTSTGETGTTTEESSSSTAASASLKDPNGVLPEGVGIAPVTSITSGTVYDNAAAAAKAKIRGISVFAVLDISLTDASIHELAGYVEVTIPVPGNLTVGDGKTIAVYRLEEDGTTLTRCESSVANGMITFKTNHFSTYIVANVPASPKMGETSNSMNAVFLIALMAGIGAVVVVKRKRI